MNKLLRVSAAFLPVLVGISPVDAGETVTNTSLPVYVTRQDCSQLVAHHPDASVAYQAGSDVHGHYVAPADLPADPSLNILSDRVTFDLKVNPLTYGARQSTVAGDRFGNNAASVAKIDVDLLSGAVKINGQSLDGEQTRIVTEACRKAGYR